MDTHHKLRVKRTPKIPELFLGFGRLYTSVSLFYDEVAAGLCESNEHYHAALEDVLRTSSASRARLFLATVLASCNLAQPGQFWQRWSTELSDDFRHEIPDAQIAASRALADLQEHLARRGKCNSDFQIPMPSHFNLDRFRLRELHAELCYDAIDEAAGAAAMREQMGPYLAQAAAFDEIRAAIDSQSPAVFFIDGPGGTGKSFLLTALLRYTRGLGDVAVACSWNGLAASLLPGGRTCHARFGFPVPLPQGELCARVSARSGKGQALVRARLILWDEIATAPGSALDASDLCLQDLCHNDTPFGGKVVVLAGDLQQTLPVVERSNRQDVVASAVTNSRLWRSGHLKRKSLKHNFRAHADAAYRDFLLQVGEGRASFELEHGPSAVYLPSELVAPPTWNPVDLARFVFPNVHAATEQVLQHPTREALRELSARALLTPKNDAVHALNDLIIREFPQHTHVLLRGHTSIAEPTPEDLTAYPPDYLNSLDLPGLPPANMHVYRGALVIFLRNIDPDRGLCNGARAIVVRASTRVLDAILLSGPHVGRRVFIPRIPMTPTEWTLPMKLVRRQFPIRLAWALTINKAQGQTLDRTLTLWAFSVFAFSPSARAEDALSSSRRPCSHMGNFTWRSPALEPLPT